MVHKLLLVTISDNNSSSCSFLDLTIKFKGQGFEMTCRTITAAMYSRLTH